MPQPPVLAIVGRPNVGKSTLFNRLLRGRRAIVDDQPGVTRDRLYGAFDWRGQQFTVVDTGGFEPAGSGIAVQIRAQAEQAVAEADAIILLVDAKDGLTPTDIEVARLLRRGTPRPIFLVVNKVDALGQEPLAAEFARLGFDATYPISAEQGRGIGELLDVVAALFPAAAAAADEGRPVTVAVVGRPNVGKSSLVNRILGTDRVVVSPEPGTTRDAVDTRFSLGGREYVLVDTAGIRAKGRSGTLGGALQRLARPGGRAAGGRVGDPPGWDRGRDGAGYEDCRRNARGRVRLHPGREQMGPSDPRAGRHGEVPP